MTDKLCIANGRLVQKMLSILFSQKLQWIKDVMSLSKQETQVADQIMDLEGRVIKEQSISEQTTTHNQVVILAANLQLIHPFLDLFLWPKPFLYY